jgi:hypothetical protein
MKLLWVIAPCLFFTTNLLSADLCEVGKHPSRFANKWVHLEGSITGGSEDFVLFSANCKEEGIFLAYPDQTADWVHFPLVKDETLQSMVTALQTSQVPTLKPGEFCVQPCFIPRYRVHVVLYGKFIDTKKQNGFLGRSRYGFIIKRVLNSEPIELRQ